MLTTILEIIKGLLQAIPLIAKYFPAKTSEEAVQEGNAQVQKDQQGFKDTGRPQ